MPGQKLLRQLLGNTFRSCAASTMCWQGACLSAARMQPGKQSTTTKTLAADWSLLTAPAEACRHFYLKLVVHDNEATNAGSCSSPSVLAARSSGPQRVAGSCSKTSGTAATSQDSAPAGALTCSILAGGHRTLWCMRRWQAHHKVQHLQELELPKCLQQLGQVAELVA